MLAAVELQAAKAKEGYVRSLKEVRDQHSTEIDDLLSQLDVVEAEHKEKFDAKAESVKQKEAIIAALGAQLAEATTRTNEIEEEREQDFALIDAAREDARQAEAETQSLRLSLERLRRDHELALEDERQKREDSCQQAREEMIAAAQAQFDQANEHYVKLKHEYDSTATKLSQMERDLKFSRKEMENYKQKQASREAETRAGTMRVTMKPASGKRHPTAPPMKIPPR